VFRDNGVVPGTTPEEFFGTDSVGLAVFHRVRAALAASHPDVTVRVSKSQVALRRRRGFAYLWVPGQYLHRSAAPVALSIAADRRIPSGRFKEVVHPGPWMHHLEVVDPDEVDAEVVGWLRSAADDAAPT
jgi:hypothetical protein